MIKPLPCPWCGSDAWTIPALSSEKLVMCKKRACSMRGPLGATEAEALEAWNSLPRQSPWVAAPDGGGKWWVWLIGQLEEAEAETSRLRKVYEAAAWVAEVNEVKADPSWMRAQLSEAGINEYWNIEWDALADLRRAVEDKTNGR